MRATIHASHVWFFVATTLVATPAFAAIPQLDPTWFASQIFWLAISFLLMLIVVRGRIAPTIESVLLSRSEAIARAVTEAEAAREEASKANADMTAAVSSARNQAAVMLAEVQAKNTAHAAETMYALDQELKAKLAKAEAATAAAKASAMTTLQEHAATLTQAIVEKIGGSTVAASDALTVTRKVS